MGAAPEIYLPIYACNDSKAKYVANLIEFEHHAIAVFEAWECQTSTKDGCLTRS